MTRETPGAGGAAPSMDWEAVARYLAGESSAEERAIVRQWLAGHPAEAKIIGALDDALAGLALKPELQRGIDVEAALASVKSRRHQPDLSVVRGGGFRYTRIQGRRVIDWRVVAAAAVVIVAGSVYWRTSARTTTETPTTIIAARSLTTPIGGRDSLVLPDGSQVLLGPGSELTIAEGFGQSERRVSLRGEALFTVVHDQSKPFTVTANGSTIRDIGTAFVVHSDAMGVRVAVTEGVVELSASPQGAPTTLNAGDAASVTAAGQVTAERGVGAGSDLAWTRGQLVFRDTPLIEVSEDLRRWYGVHLDIRDAALRTRPLSATFHGDSIASVLGVISQALGASIERRGDTAIVRSMPR